MIETLKGRRIAVIGGAGFIGHHLALELRRLGAAVSVVDGLAVNNLLSHVADTDKAEFADFYVKLTQQRLALLRAAGVDLHVVDARDYLLLSNTLGKIKPQVIIHMAAVAHAGVANKSPFSTFDHSLRTLENALDCARGVVEHFIYLSSSMVYGNFATGEVSEETRCDPIGIYSALKLSGEHLVNAYRQVFGLVTTIVRPSALYGERCVSRRVSQIFIENALLGRPIAVKGAADERIDFTYVNDLVAGLVCVMTNKAALNETFNLTYGQSRSLVELIDILRSHFPHLTVRYEERDHLMPVRGTLSIDKARRLIGYNPQFPLEVGIERYVAWYRTAGLSA